MSSYFVETGILHDTYVCLVVCLAVCLAVCQFDNRFDCLVFHRQPHNRKALQKVFGGSEPKLIGFASKVSSFMHAAPPLPVALAHPNFLF